MEYLIKSSALLILFYICYKVLLQKDTFFKTNRWFLLSGLVISFCLPLLVIPIYITKEISVQFQNINTQVGIESAFAETTFNWQNLMLFIYSIGVMFLSIRFVIQLISLAITLSKGTSSKKDNFIVIQTKDDVAPFSFFNYIVFNPSHFNSEELEHIINHEKVHANQNHSIDILLSQIAAIFCWFNPFIWLYKKDLQQNLEFIADNEALLQSTSTKSYQYVLLKTSVPNYHIALTNNFYNSLIKKRIVMLHKSKSKKRNQFKMVFILPVLAIFLMSFSTEEIISYKVLPEDTSKDIKNVSDSKIELSNDIETPTPSALPSKTPIDLSTTKITKKDEKSDVDIIIITKNTTDKELDDMVKRAAKDGITLKFKNVKRNKNNEIKAIKISAKSKNSNASISQTEDDAIDPITIKIEDGSISIGDGHDSGHRDYVFKSHDGHTKVIKSSKATNVHVQTHSDGDDNISVIVNGKVKKVKKGKGDKSIWVTSGDDHGKHEIIEIREHNGTDSIHLNGNVHIMTKDKDGNLIKTSSKNIWISDDDTIIEADSIRVKGKSLWKFEADGDDDTILELKNDTNHLFISSDKKGKQALYVVNGTVIGSGELNGLDTNNIASVNVLKGDAAIKKYGKKGKNGVIEITTKN